MKVIEVPLLVVEPRTVSALLEGLVRLNMEVMPADAPPVLALKYEREPRGRDVWQPADVLLRSGRGDCEDLAAYDAAWRRLHGLDATAVAYRAGRRTLHAIVNARGEYLDPSAATGMLDVPRKR